MKVTLRNRTKIARVALWAAAFALSVASFQNCERVQFQSSPQGSTSKSSTAVDSNLDGGSGIDGKLGVYASIGDCDGLSQIKDVILVGANIAAVSREDCKDLRSARAIDSRQLRWIGTDRARFIYSDKIFDRQTDESHQNVTLNFCSDPNNNDSFVWFDLFDSSQYSSGRANLQCLNQPQPDVSAFAPRAGAHYAPTANFLANGTLDPSLIENGFNLVDVSTVSEYRKLPAQAKALVYLDSCKGADSAFVTKALSFTTNAQLALQVPAEAGATNLAFAATAGLVPGMIVSSLDSPSAFSLNTKVISVSATDLTLDRPLKERLPANARVLGVLAPQLFGFYLADGADPDTCAPSVLSAESDWIHRHLGSSVVSFMVLDPLKGSFGSGYSYCASGCSATDHFGADNTSIDYFGVMAYACRSELSGGKGGCDFADVDREIDAVLQSGVKASQIIPIYPTFGGGNDRNDEGGSYVVPKAAQLATLQDRWGRRLPTVAWDYYYTWGAQNGSSHLRSESDLLKAVNYLNHRAP